MGVRDHATVWTARAIRPKRIYEHARINKESSEQLGMRSTHFHWPERCKKRISIVVCAMDPDGRFENAAQFLSVSHATPRMSNAPPSTRAVNFDEANT